MALKQTDAGSSRDNDNMANVVCRDNIHTTHILYSILDRVYFFSGRQVKSPLLYSAFYNRDCIKTASQ